MRRLTILLMLLMALTIIGPAQTLTGGAWTGGSFSVVTQAPAITSANNTTFTQSSSGTFTVTTTGTPNATLTELGSLPSGVTFTDNGNGTATLAGTPTVAGTFTLVFTANNGITPNATQSFTLTVNPSGAPPELWTGFLSLASGSNCGSTALTASGVPTRCGIDWTTVGTGGIPARATVYTTINSSSCPAGTADCASVIQTQLNAATSGDAVLLAAGTFRVNTNVNVPSNITLRGSGADQTIIDGHGTSGAVITLGTGPTFGTEVAITAGGTANSTGITVSSATGITVGKYLLVSMINDGLIATNYGGEGMCTWCDSFWFGSRTTQQIVKVTNVSGANLTISPALRTDFSPTNQNPPNFVNPFAAGQLTKSGSTFYVCTGTCTTAPPSGSWQALITGPTALPFTMSETAAGVEDLQVFGNHSGYATDFYMNGCAGCWIKGTEVNYADGDWVEVEFGSHDEIRDGYFSNGFSHTPGSTDNDIVLRKGTSDTLVENNILERGHLSVMLEWGAMGNVVGYNYTEGEFASDSQNFVMGGLGMHGANPEFTLFEGNVTNRIEPDEIWGSSAYTTLFRNFSLGTTVACLPQTGRSTVNCTPLGFAFGGSNNGWWTFQGSRAIAIDHLAPYTNLIGNVAGSSEQAGIFPYQGGTQAVNVPSIQYPTARSYDSSNYNLSFGYGEASDPGNTGTGCDGSLAPPCHSTNAFSTAFLHGNYTYGNNTTSYAVGVSTTLPSSFYYSSTPSWWTSTLAFPAIGPDVTTGGADSGTHAALIPAQNCYLNVMHGSIGGAGSPLVFNRNTCYTAPIGNSGPLTYPARFDTCVKVGDPGCTGAPTGKNGSPLVFLGQPNDPMPWHMLDPQNTIAVDPDFGTTMVMATDRNTPCGNVTSSWNLGLQGNHAAFSTDKQFLLITNQFGVNCLLVLNYTSIHNKTCATIPCVSYSPISVGSLTPTCNPANTSWVASTNCTVLQSNAGFSWSTAPGEAHILYELSNTNILVNRLTVNSAGTSFTRVPVVNFTSDFADAAHNISVPCSVLPPTYQASWNGTFQPSADGTVGYPVGGGPDWTASTAYASPNSIVKPLLNNPGNFGFQSSGGTSGTSEPTWSASCGVEQQTCTGDGSISTWTNIGKVVGQGSSVFDFVLWDPKRGCRRMNTMTGQVVNGTNEGTSYPASGGTADPTGQIVTDSAAALFNICTLTQTRATCAALWPATSGTETSTWFEHDSNLNLDPTFVTFSPTGAGAVPSWPHKNHQSCKGQSGVENYCYLYFWERSTLNVRASMGYTNVTGSSDVYGHNAGHEIMAQVYGFSDGRFYPHYYFAPNNSDGSSNPAVSPMFAASPNWDQHGSPQSTNSTDTVPLLMSMSQEPSVGRNTNANNAGYSESTLGSLVVGYNEVFAIAFTAANCPAGSVGLGVATYCAYRFAHNWNTGSAPVIATQNAVGVTTKDGTLWAHTSDVMGYRGSVSPLWAQNTTYDYGDMINPISSANAAHSTYQNLTGVSFKTTATETEVNWGACQTSGQTCTGTASGELWTNVSAIVSPSNQGTIQLPCNNLRGDYTTNSFPSAPALGDRILNLANVDIYEVTNIGAGVMGKLPTFTTAGTCANFNGTCTDGAGVVTFTNRGLNDCKGDVIIDDLMSATR